MSYLANNNVFWSTLKKRFPPNLYLYVFGGWYNSNSSPDYGIHDDTVQFDGSSWVAKTLMFTNKSYHGATAIKLKSYVYGGRYYSAVGSNIVLKTCEEYDSQVGGGGTWTAKTDVPVASSMQQPASATLNNKGYVFGNNITPKNVCHEYVAETDTWTVQTAPPSNIYEGSGFALNKRKLGFVQDHSAAWTYDPKVGAGGTWTVKTGPSTSAAFAFGAVLANKAYCFGGINGFTPNQEYDIGTNSWAYKAVKPTGTYWHAAAEINEKAYAIGGNKTGDVQYGGTEEFVLNTWASKTALPGSPRYKMPATSTAV